MERDEPKSREPAGGEEGDDVALLRRYVADRSEAAFAELVRRRIGLVYAVAVRQCGGDAHLAEDVTQEVFADLARKAGTLMARPALSGWLYRGAHFAASDVVRAERRRRAREEASGRMNETTGEAAGGMVDGEKLRPMLDAAMTDLDDDDRDAVTLRYIEEKSYAEIGRALRLAEDTARKRVERALDKLHAALARRGVTSTNAALALALANQAAATVPAGLVASVTAGALAGAATGAGAVGWGLAGFMGTKATVGIVGALVLAGIGTAWWGTAQARQAEEALAAAKREQAALNAKLNGLEAQVQTETRRVAAAEAENARLLAAAEKLRAAPVDAAPAAHGAPVTSGMVQARWRRAQELAKDGDPAEALQELLWCYDVGMVHVSSMLGVRLSSALSALAKLGERYPAALAALRERREKSRARVMADENDFSVAQEFGAINRALKDEATNLALFDQLPPGDRRRLPLSNSSNSLLMEARRYKDAVEGRPYSMISSLFELRIKQTIAPNHPDPVGARQRNREAAITGAVKDIEMLAGAGDLAHARMLADRLLAFDSADSTKALIQKHADRAGQPALMAPTSSPK
ncbi:MAG: sigma-70 family RNA polymerase sigma factor [Verrucomicrobia bacterium]|nr:sigma-70 family RNA polymerase sigma factor [Verrucomicrobiota bacterium]